MDMYGFGGTEMDWSNAYPLDEARKKKKENQVPYIHYHHPIYLFTQERKNITARPPWAHSIPPPPPQNPALAYHPTRTAHPVASKAFCVHAPRPGRRQNRSP